MNENRAPRARLLIILFLVFMGFLAYQNSASAAPSAPQLTAPVALSAPPTTFGHVAWLSSCGITSSQLGLYAKDDATCHPSRTVSLNWLQSQLTTYGVLASGEYLERVADPNRPACLARILSGSAATATGWLCSEGQGLYRLNATGQDTGARWLLWSE